MKTNRLKWIRSGAALAGAMDFLTGVALVFAPAPTLRLMQVAPPGAEAMVFLRWVGAFVGAVGASYLLAAWNGSETRLRAVLSLTVVFRLAAGGYSAAAIWAGWLSPAWASVPVTDLALVVVQLWLLGRKDWTR